MAIYSKSITGLINGVSRQPFAMRLDSHGEEQINCISSVSGIVKRRPGMQLAAKLSVSPNTNDAWHWIDRSSTQRYLVRVANNSTTIGITDLIAGTSTSITGNAYTTVSGALTNLRFLTTGDTTYICNTTVQPKFRNPTGISNVVSAQFVAATKTITVAAGGLLYMGYGPGMLITVTTTTSNNRTYSIASLTDTVITVNETTVVDETDATTTITAPTVSPAKTLWGFVWVKAAVIGAVYNINAVLQGGGTPRIASYTALSGDNTAMIAAALKVQIDAVGMTSDFDCVQFGSIIAISGLADQQTTDYNISVSDGWGDQALVAVKNGAKVQSFALLPPSGVEGMTVEVDGDPESNVDSYWVKFVMAPGTAAQYTGSTYGGVNRGMGTGVWSETVKPSTTGGTIAGNTSIPTVIDSSTMPQVLSFNGTTWSVAGAAWGQREVGDTITAPNPPFLSDYAASLPSTAPTITDLAYFKNRLALVSGESVSFSGVNDYASFFPTTVVTTADDDAFSITANYPDVAKLKFAIPFQDLLVLFAQSGIFGIEVEPGAPGLTPGAARFTRLSNFTGTASIRPAAAGDRIFFTEDLNNRLVVREFTKSNSGDGYLVETISEHIYDYLDSSALRSLTADGASQMLVASGANFAPKTWVYQWFTSNAEKVQSSWHSWSLNGDYGASAATLCISFSCQIIKGDVYNVVWVPKASNASVAVVKCPLDPVNYSGASALNGPETPYADYWSLVVGANVAGNAVFTITQPIEALAASATTDLVVLGYGSAWGAAQGTEITGGVYVASTPEQTALKFTGTTYVGRTLLIGTRYRSYYDFTPPVKKDQSGVPVLSGRYFARRWRARFQDRTSVVCHRTVGPKVTGNTTHVRTLAISNKRTAEFPVHMECDPTLNTGFYSEQALTNFKLWGVDWDLEWSPRARSL